MCVAHASGRPTTALLAPVARLVGCCMSGNRRRGWRGRAGRRPVPGHTHYFGWYALNVLGLPPHGIALEFGHQDGGQLVRTTYAHPDAAIARERVREAYRRAPAAPIPLVATR